MGPTLTAFEEAGVEVCVSLSTFHFRTSHYEYTSNVHVPFYGTGSRF